MGGPLPLQAHITWSREHRGLDAFGDEITRDSWLTSDRIEANN
jgi:hypothetical protein